MTEYIDHRFSMKIEDGILYAVFNEEHVDYSLVNDGVTIKKELMKEKSYPMFSDFRKVKSGTRQARERMAAKDAGKGVKAVAVLINSKVHRTIYNFFHSIYKAPAPAKLFTDRDKAIKWLEQYK